MISRLFLIFLFNQFFLIGNVISDEVPTKIRVAYFSQDPPSISPLSSSFDPDTYAVAAQIFDPLVIYDLEGLPKPGLAEKWEKTSETNWRFWLRKGVKFHNGQSFDGRDVVATFNYIMDPNNKAGNSWIFNSLESVNIYRDNPYIVDIKVRYPDAMFLNRLNLFSSILSRHDIDKGLDYFSVFPNGTGPFRFKAWNKGRSIELVRYEAHWNSELNGNLDVSFVILDKDKWIEGLINESVDFVPNLKGSATAEVMLQGKGKIGLIKRPILAGYWGLIKNDGPLKNPEVRKALNLAVNRQDMIKLADNGNAIEMASIGLKGAFGHNPNLKPVPYDPEQAIQILRDMKLLNKLHLKVLSADISEPIARIISKNIESIGIKVSLEVVSRSQWAKIVVNNKIKTGKRANYDLAINFVDNPIYHLGFHAGLFLDSASPWSLLKLSDFDQRFQKTMTSADPKEHEQLLKELDQFVQDRYLMLFTTQRIITAAYSKKFEIAGYGKNGHLGYYVLSQAKLAKRD